MDSFPSIPTRPCSPPHLASSKLFSYTFAGHHIDGIQKALEGTSEVRQVWCDDSLLYTSCEARTVVIHAEGHARAPTPSNPVHSQHLVATAQPHTNNPTGDYHVTDCPKSIHKEEEDLGDAGMDRETPHGSHTGKGSPHIE